MKWLLLFLILAINMAATLYGQDRDSRRRPLPVPTASDTNIVKQLLTSSNLYSFNNPDTGIVLAQKALDLATALHFRGGEIEALMTIGEAYHFLGDYPQALRMQFEALRITREIKDLADEAVALGFIGIIYNELGQYRQALQYLLLGDKLSRQLPGAYQGSFILANIGDSYDFMNMLDSALFYQRMAYDLFKDTTRPHLKSFLLRHMGNIYAELGKNDSALKFYNEGISISRLANDKLNLSMNYKKIADLYESVNQHDSSLYYARMAFDDARGISVKLHILQASSLLTKLYNQLHNSDSSFFYLNITSAMKDSLYGPEKYRQLQILMLDEQQRQQIITHQAEQFKNKIKYIALVTALGVFFLLAFILLKNNRRKQKANNLLTEQKGKVEEALKELRSMQSQLIQSEKMASLGELTAGIAHEIQNPLNFVNNFSEVNKELVRELKEEIKKGNIEEVNALANDIEANEEKINHHGKRADAIVKGMLQHSRSSSGAKEPTDINALCDEYLRLSYHGLRAKDKSFNATIKTAFDQSIGKINIIPPDIGRVILNLLTNGFYVVNEKKQMNIDGYEPTISVSTKKIADKVEIRVADNGNGIPQKVLDKIFQPFFTTKPTGQGTGLGLSMSYDIVKAHGGEIKVETKEGEGTVFVLTLISPF